MTVRIDCADGRERARAVSVAAAAVRRGDLVIIPTENAYVVVADAFSPRGTQDLREAKGQSQDTPLGVLVARPGTVSGLAADIPPQARAVMAALWPGMVTILLEPQPTLLWDHPPGSPIALRAPAHPVALAVVGETGPLVASAVTIDGDPVRTCDVACEVHSEVAIALDAGFLDTRWSQDEDPELASTIVDLRSADPVFLRHGAVDEERVRAAIALTQ